MTGDGRLARGMAAAALAAAVATTVPAGSAAADTAAAGTITTVAGGVGGPAPATDIAMSPCGATFAGGNLYIADGLDLRKVSPASDWLTTAAGTGSPGPAGNGLAATRADLAGACSVAPDAAGNLLLADTSHFQVRVVAAKTGTFYGQAMTAGHIYAVAGDGTGGYSGDGGPATSAELRLAEGVAVDHAGNLVIADTDNERIRVVAARSGRFYGQAMTAGDIYTVAGDGNFGFAGDGGPATSAELWLPQSVAVDSDGNLVIADTENSRVRVVAASTGTFYGQAMTAGDIYTVAGDGKSGYGGDRHPATSAELSNPEGVAVDASGDLLIADRLRLRVVAASTGTRYQQEMIAGDIYTVAGRSLGGPPCCTRRPAIAAQLTSDGVALDHAGNTVIAALTQIQVVPSSTGRYYGQAMTAGDIYTVAGDGTEGYSGDGGPATSAEIGLANEIGVDGAGNLVFADAYNSRIRVVAVQNGTFYGQAMTAGDIYTVAGDGTFGYSGDGGPATSAELANTYGVAVDAAGNLVIADTFNYRVRVVAVKTGTFYGRAMTAGDIYTVAGDGTQGYSGDGGSATSAEISAAQGVAVDNSGNLLLADTNNNRVRVVAARTGSFYGRAMTAGDIYTIAGDGGPAASAKLDLPVAVAVDAAGNVAIADMFNNRIRVVAVQNGTFYGQPMTAGDIYTVAGDGSAGFSGDGGPGTQAELDNPNGVTVAGSGALMISDGANGRVRELTG